MNGPWLRWLYNVSTKKSFLDFFATPKNCEACKRHTAKPEIFATVLFSLILRVQKIRENKKQ